MATRRWYDLETRMYWDMLPLAVVRAVEPFRHGWQGELRQTVRCLLLQAMGFECGDVPLNAQIPHRFPKGRFTTEDRHAFVFAAYDGLRELGYEAAADMIAEKQLRGADAVGIGLRAKDALENLESGPPSVTIGNEAIFAHTLKEYRDDQGNAYVVGRAVHDPRWWYRYFVGVPVYSRSGTREGWDPNGGYTFQRRGRTLEDVLTPLYGSAKLEKAPPRRGSRLPPWGNEP